MSAVLNSLMARTTIAQKLTLLGFLVVAPIALLTTVIIRDNLSDMRASRDEINGVSYLQELWPALVTAARGEGASVDLAGLRDRGREFDDAFESGAAAQSFLGRAQTEPFAATTLNAGLDLVGVIADGAGLVLDRDLSAFYAMEAATDDLPELLGMMRLTADVVRGASDAGLAETVGKLEGARDGVGDALDAAVRFDETGVFGGDIAAGRQQLAAQVRAFEEAVMSGADDAALRARLAETVSSIDGVWRATIVDLADMYATRAEARRNALIANVVLAIGLLAVAALVMLGIGHGIITGVSSLVARMQRLMEGDVESDVPHRADRNELGEIAKAVIVFRQNAIDMRRLEEARLAAEAKAAEDRALLEAELNASVGAVVAAAGRGDFSQRAAESERLGNLRSIASGLNGLCAAAEAFLADADRAAAAFAAGDLSHRITRTYEGRFGIVADNLNRAAGAAGQAMGQATLAAQTTLGAAQEIQTAAEDMSARAEEQAANLEETAAALEEMTSSVKQNADNAREAAASARQTSQQAADTSQIARQAVSAMQAIESSSGKIADITGLIDGIAFQTNLLALNAAVEAARAGDAGKGFAVVAAEVRTLAQRCADAAKDIRGLIQASQREVGDGVKLVTSAGAALDAIVASVRGVSETVADIANASREQSEAVSQVAQTVAHLDQITQQNSALADQSAGAARGLSSEAEQLSALLSAFRTGVEAPAVKAAAAPVRRPAAGKSPVVAKARAQVSARRGGPLAVAHQEDWSEF